MSDGAAGEALFDAVALWEVRSTFGAGEVISAAVDALVAGIDSPSLRELAGVSAEEDYWTLRPLVEGTLDELDISYPGPGTDEIQVAAARAMCKRLLKGSLPPREFAAWAHSTIGHEGAARLQPLVELDDVYDVSEYTGDNLQDLDDAARSEARRLLAGEPLQATRTSPSQQDRTPAVDVSIGRLRSVLRRARDHLHR